jgi:RHS repeat-associated protein
MVASYQYDAFGTTLQEMGSVNNPYRFASREWDVESGLYYYRARYYNAVFGRFLQRDPAGMVDGPNVYGYVKNNPVNYRDPTGRSSWLPIKMNCPHWEYVCKPKIEFGWFGIKIKTECKWRCIYEVYFIFFPWTT